MKLMKAKAIDVFTISFIFEMCLVSNKKRRVKSFLGKRNKKYCNYAI